LTILTAIVGVLIAIEIVGPVAPPVLLVGDGVVVEKTGVQIVISGDLLHVFDAQLEVVAAQPQKQEARHQRNEFG
jgi:hypothetical protein